MEHDYPIAAAKLAKQGGLQHFHLVSSMGVNENSFLLYGSTKVCDNSYSKYSGHRAVPKLLQYYSLYNRVELTERSQRWASNERAFIDQGRDTVHSETLLGVLFNIFSSVFLF